VKGERARLLAATAAARAVAVVKEMLSSIFGWSGYICSFGAPPKIVGG